jgi:hypothetical protein
LYHDIDVKEEDHEEPARSDDGAAIPALPALPAIQATPPALEEVRDPELEAIREKIVQRRSSWQLAAVLGVAVLLVGSAIFGWVMRSSTTRLSPLPPLSEEDAAALSRALEEASDLPGHRRRAKVGRALAHVEQRRIPMPLVSAWMDGAQMSEHERLAVLRRALAHPEVRPLWERLCPERTDIEELDAEPKSGIRTFQACGLHRLALMSPSHVVTARGSEVLAAHAAYEHLRAREALTDIETRALRALCEGTVDATPAVPWE